MADEMAGKFIGPMPVNEFLNMFLPTRRKKANRYTRRIQSRFAGVPTNSGERAMYQPLVCLFHDHFAVAHSVR